MRLLQILKNSSVATLCLTLSLSMAALPISRDAQAGMIATGDAVASLTQAQNREKVASFLSRADVRQELVKFGVDPAEASQRVASLSDAELQKLAQQIDQGTAGGEVVVISLTTLLLIIIIILLIR